MKRRLEFALSRFFEGVPLRPITPWVGVRGLAIAAVFTTIVAVVMPSEMRWDVVGLGAVFLGCFIGIVISDAGLNIREYPKQTIAVIVVISLAVLCAGAVVKAVMLAQ